jgi:hypothetical protein
VAQPGPRTGRETLVTATVCEVQAAGVVQIFINLSSLFRYLTHRIFDKLPRVRVAALHVTVEGLFDLETCYE